MEGPAGWLAGRTRSAQRCKFTRELLLLPDLSTSSFVPAFYPLLTPDCAPVLSVSVKYLWVSVYIYTRVDVEASFIALSVVTSIW